MISVHRLFDFLVLGVFGETFLQIPHLLEQTYGFVMLRLEHCAARIALGGRGRELVGGGDHLPPTGYSIKGFYTGGQCWRVLLQYLQSPWMTALTSAGSYEFMNHTIITLAADGVYLASLAAMRDVMQIADHIISRQLMRLQSTAAMSLPTFERRLISVDGEPVTTACGLRLSMDGGLDDIGQATVVYLPAIYIGIDAAAWLRDREKPMAQLLPWLGRQWQGGASIGTVATSNLLLAEAGLLQKMRVSVPWAMEAFLHRRYPATTSDPHREIVKADNIYCAGNLSSSLSLAIELIGQYAPPTITELLNQYVRPMERALEATHTGSSTAIGDPLVVRAAAMIQKMFTQSIDYARLARDLAVSQRTLNRHFNRELGVTPQIYQQQLRVEAARHLLAQTQLPIARVAEYMGYANAAYFSRLFRQRLGISIQDYQAQSRLARARAAGGAD